MLFRAVKKNEEIPCSLCGEKIKSKYLEDHEQHECPCRQVSCPREDCEELVQARDLDDHMKFSCNSRLYLRRCWMIARGRKRLNYPRPWGIEIPLFTENEELPVENVATTKVQTKPSSPTQNLTRKEVQDGSIRPVSPVIMK